jgi:Cu/Ag efflux protein CusF
MHKTTFLALALALGGASALAQDTEGEVRKLDKAQSRITLKHGEIKNLGMPPMTMVFRVTDAKLFDGLAVGDKVTFAADKLNDQFVVTALAKRKR